MDWIEAVVAAAGGGRRGGIRRFPEARREQLSTWGQRTPADFCYIWWSNPDLSVY